MPRVGAATTAAMSQIKIFISSLSFRCRRRNTNAFTKQGVVHALLEAPAASRLDVGIFVVPVIFNLVGIAAQSDHEHIDRARRSLHGWRDDVVHIEMTNALYDPPDILASARATTGDLGEP